VGAVQGGEKPLIGPGGAHLTLLVEQVKDAVRRALDQLQNRAVVRVDDALQCDALVLVVLLLLDKHPLVEEELEYLVSEVDAELLERVRVEHLEAEDVEVSLLLDCSIIRLFYY
jgi:hypothetical protein